MKNLMIMVALLSLAACNFKPAEAKQMVYPWSNLPAEEQKEYETGVYDCLMATETLNFILTLPVGEKHEDTELNTWSEYRAGEGIQAVVSYLIRDEKRYNIAAIAGTDEGDAIFLLEYHLLKSFFEDPNKDFDFNLVEGEYFCVFPQETF